MTAKEHNKLVGIFLMAHGGLQAVIMLILGLVYGGIGSVILATAKKSEEQMVGLVFVLMIVFLLFMGLVFVLPQLIGGLKLFRERSNARIWGIVGSIISCLSFPLGTAAGVYGLWFLFGDMGKQLYSGGPTQYFQNPQQPPPNSWQ